MLIGLTGGIASGKSTVSQMFKDLAIPLIDADQVAREVVERGSETLNAIARRFGEEVINEDGSLARKKLGAIVFQDPQEREALNQLIHPAIRKRMNELKDAYLEGGATTVVFDIPLLYESNLFHLVDKVLLVYVDAETQLTRLMQRDKAGEKDAKQRIASQIPMDEKRTKADAIIDNSGTIEETKKQLDEILKKWQIKRLGHN